MMLSMSATDVAFSMAAVIQAIAALLWALGVRALGDIRHSALHWAGYAALSAISFVLLVLALHYHAEPPEELLRAMGNLCAIAGMLVLQRGIWLFIGRPTADRLQLGMLIAGCVIGYLGLEPERASMRVGANSLLLCLLCMGMGRDLSRHGRLVLGFRWPWVLASPMWLGMVGFAGRGALAVFQPNSVSAEMTTNSALNVGSTLGYVVLVVALHATLTALVINQLVGELRRRSRHDGLTGLLNRRAIEEALVGHVRSCARSGQRFVVMMLDLDHFKSINDRHGHPVGDLALKHVSHLLKSTLREVDHLARFGGEEFLAVLPGVSVPGARVLAERLRQTLNERPMSHEALAIPVSVSIGIAQWSGAEDEIGGLLIRADAALLLAKQRGRDRVVVAEPDTEPSGDPA
jgi:diguanylate cyclase (GGDEF)-like protein